MFLLIVSSMTDLSVCAPTMSRWVAVNRDDCDGGAAISRELRRKVCVRLVSRTDRGLSSQVARETDRETAEAQRRKRKLGFETERGRGGVSSHRAPSCCVALRRRVRGRASLATLGFSEPQILPRLCGFSAPPPVRVRQAGT